MIGFMSFDITSNPFRPREGVVDANCQLSHLTVTSLLSSDLVYQKGWTIYEQDHRCNGRIDFVTANSVEEGLDPGEDLMKITIGEMHSFRPVIHRSNCEFQIGEKCNANLDALKRDLSVGGLF